MKILRSNQNLKECIDVLKTKYANESPMTKTIFNKAVNKPTVNKPTVKKPTVKKSIVKKPTVNKPTVKKPTVKKSTVKKPTVKKSTVKKPTVKKPTVKKATVKKQTTNKPLPIKKDRRFKTEKATNRITILLTDAELIKLDKLAANNSITNFIKSKIFK